MTSFFILTALVVLAVEAASVQKEGIASKLTQLQKDVTYLVETLNTMKGHLKDVHIHVHGAATTFSHHHWKSHLPRHGAHFQHFGHGPVAAHCDILPNTQLKSGPKVKGHIHLVQNVFSEIKVNVNLQGFPTDKSKKGYALHVHELNDTSKSCNSLGSHYNPHNFEHGTKEAPHGSRHAGDWGNIYANSSGIVDLHFHDNEASLVGKHSIIGRSIVIHAKPDGGNTGERIACCVITEAKKYLPITPYAHHKENDEDED